MCFNGVWFELVVGFRCLWIGGVLFGLWYLLLIVDFGVFCCLLCLLVDDLGIRFGLDLIVVCWFGVGLAVC